MATRNGRGHFPEKVLRYSALRYLQRKVAGRCRELPDHFRSLKEWERYRGRLLAALRRKLPVWELAGRGSSQVLGENPLGSQLVVEVVDVDFEDGFCIPVHVYRAREASGKRPAVIVCPGYCQPKNASDVVAICMALANAGFLALAMEYDGTGERADRPDAGTDVDNVTAVGQMLGITNVGLRVMTNAAALRYLQGRRDVDPERIAITGLCQGSIVSWFTAALFPPFAATALLCGATTYEAIALEYCNRQGGWSGTSPYVFNLLEDGDVQHVIAAIAPRPLFIQNNLIDLHWPMSGFENVKRCCTQVYGFYHAEDQCRLMVEHGPHAFAEPFNSNIVQWLKKKLEPA